MNRSQNQYKIYRLSGEEGRPFVNALAELRLKIFWEYPYLYEGNLNYEKKYLETYFKSKNSFILLLKDHEKFIGATTGIWAEDESVEFKSPYEHHGLDPKKIFYFGESVLLSEYRGKGLGKLFFEERERFARALGHIQHLSFCAVVRPDDHVLRPQNYRPLDEFWKSQGFHVVPNLTTSYMWKDRDLNSETEKQMQYWIKSI
ncbi:MAG: GNAT family N-acetyltransferase [Bdellovibrionales bacterium]|nr:GNAT family N-acetyltransferase [Bdellovibrionales bacterium]